MGQRSYLVLTLLLGGCGLANVLPGPPVATGQARTVYDESRPATIESNGFIARVAYKSEPAVPFPVLPVQIWGLRYALDVVLVSDHPDWVMHEYAKIWLPTGAIWMAKDAGKDREQTIVADIPNIESWVPEVPVRRISRPLPVQESGEDGVFQVDLSYQNPLNQATNLRYVGPMPTEPSHPRNGNTMGHSRKSVAALLDLYLFRIGGDVSLQIDGVQRKIDRLLGLLPQTYLLAQVQGGFATTNFKEYATEAGFAVLRPGDGSPWPTAGTEVFEDIGDGWYQRVNPVVDLFYHFVDGELERAFAVQIGSEVPLVTLTFSPRLPDARRHFEGTAISNFVVDVNGQPGHGIGTIATSWQGDEVHVDLRPTEPRWFADRPMNGRVRYEGGAAYVTMERVDVDPR